MKLDTKILTLLVLWLGFCQVSKAQDYPSITPSMSITTADGETSDDDNYSGSAPIRV